jgi:hypothetical protein
MFPELENNDDLYDPNDRGTMEFILCKHRNGPTGSVKLDFAASAVRLSPRIHQPDPDDYSESGDTDIPFE